MNCQGFYEAEVIDDATGEVVQYAKSKNTVLYGFVGGLFKQLFGVATDNTALTPTDNPSRYADVEQAQFGRLFLFKSSTATAAGDSNLPSSYTMESTEDKGWMNLQTAGKITQYSAVFDPANSKVTLTFQCTFSTQQGLYGSDNPTVWYGIGVGSIDIAAARTATSRLLTRVTMGSPIQKSNSQTLRVRYNFSIIVA